MLPNFDYLAAVCLIVGVLICIVCLFIVVCRFGLYWLLLKLC